jgi:translation initiation factor 2 subunit 2
MDYEDSLDRALAETPEISDSVDRFQVPDAEVRPEGNVTIFENFQATYDRLNREASHLLKFLQTELGTSASIDDRGRARFTGDFKRSRVQAAVDEYVETFVACPECDSPDTRLIEERGATMLKCDACGARSPVPEN